MTQHFHLHSMDKYAMVAIYDAATGTMQVFQGRLQETVLDVSWDVSWTRAKPSTQQIKVTLTFAPTFVHRGTQAVMRVAEEFVDYVTEKLPRLKDGK